MLLLDLRIDLGGREVLVAERVGDVGKADASHPEVSAETVSKGVYRGRLDLCSMADVLELLEDMAVPLTDGVRKHPLIAGPIRVLLEEKLLHGRRDWNHALVGFRLPAHLRLGLDEDDSQVEVKILPRQVLDLAFPHSREQDRGEESALVLTAGGKEFPNFI